MKFHWLLPSFLGIFLLSSPAQAARLQFWRFNANQNQLEFTTEGGVQPRAQLLSNPTRLVIDLPGTTLGRPKVTQAVGGSISNVRVGQFDRQTTRIVVELAPGYTINPQEVRVRGASPSQWTVQLPTPQRVVQSSSPIPAVTVPSVQSGRPLPATGAATQIQSVRVTPDGFFVGTNRGNPDLQVNRSGDRRRITIDMQGTTLSPRLTQRDLLVNRFGVNRLQVSQVQTSPAVARITLNVSESSPDWQATVSNLGGVVLVPTGGVSATTPDNRRPQPATVPIASPGSVSQQPPNAGPPQANPLATVQSVELNSSGTQLLIKADRALTYTSSWNQSAGAYQITISPANLANQVKGPQLNARSPLLRVRLRQDGPNTVVVLVQPAAGVQIGEVSQPSDQLLSLQLQRSRTAPGLPPTGSIPVPAPSTSGLPPQLPRVPNGRIVVVVDPGHGGPDPGAVGIGGLQEKGVVLDISQQLAGLLERQGVQAVLTRPDDRDLDLEPRVQLAERINASVFVSIHANSISLSRPDVNGLETYYYNSGARLARTVHDSILRNVGIQDRGVRSARFYVLRKTSMPAILVEVGFVTGADDAAKLSNPAFRAQMAAAIAQGVLQYIQQGF